MDNDSKARMAAKIVSGIERDMTGRRGLRHQWDQVDEEIKDEVRAVWRGIVIVALDEAGL